MTLLLLLLAGWVVGGTIVFLAAQWRTSRLEREAKRNALRVARGHGRISGRTMFQMGCGCPNAWPSNDRELDEFNRGARDGWFEAQRELVEGERWVVEEAERITRTAGTA